MRLHGKRVGTIGADDIQSLIDSGVRESRMLEYKLELPGSSDEDKRGFLADLSALANTVGGVVIFGIETTRDAAGNDTGIAQAAPGLTCPNMDKEKQRLTSLLRDGVRPPLISRVVFQELVVRPATQPLLILGTDVSFERPHMMTLKGSSRFYRRSEAVNYQPDISELRRMFLESASWIEECVRFRASRLEQVRSEPGLECSSYVMVQILPLGRLDTRLDLRNMGEQLNRKFPPLNPYGWGSRFNADGFMTFSEDKGAIHAYSQVYRFGGIEGFSSRFVDERDLSALGKPAKLLYAARLADKLKTYVRDGKRAMSELLGIDAPFCLLLTVHGVLNAYIPAQHHEFGAPIGRNTLLLPPILIEQDSDTDAHCRDLLDIVWQAGGWPGAPDGS